jgi:dolichyl-phosphate-mannose--protein O-mannosyl transferase
MTAASLPTATRRDPLWWCVLFSLGFFGIVLIRLAIPSKPMFDEVHYLPAARNLLALSTAVNREHPMLGKEILALGMWAFGDNPWGWRLPSAIMGTIGLFAGMRTIWLASRSDASTTLFGLLLATNFSWFIQSRIAMLDMAMAMCFAVAMWQAVAAWARPERARLHLALCGVFLGLSLSAKWTAAPLLAMPGLAFLWLRWKAQEGRRSLRTLLLDRDDGPATGVSLIEAAVWLGLVPAIVYLVTFIPYYFFEVRRLNTLWDLFALQHKMVTLQDSVVKPHTYMSRWWQWVLNIRPIWYLYENVDGAQRGVLLLGNPFTMLAALPAIGWCAWKGVKGDPVKLAVAVLWLAGVLFWAVNGKPVQFYYHYLLPAGIAMGALALVVGEWWDRDVRWPALVVAGTALLFFFWFFPILSADALPRKDSYTTYTWLYTWR